MSGWNDDAGDWHDDSTFDVVIADQDDLDRADQMGFPDDFKEDLLDEKDEWRENFRS